MRRFTFVFLLIVALLSLLSIQTFAQDGFATIVPEDATVAPVDDVMVLDVDEPEAIITLTQSQYNDLINAIQDDGIGAWGALFGVAIAIGAGIALAGIYFAAQGAPPWSKPLLLEAGKTIASGAKTFVNDRLEVAQSTKTTIDDEVLGAVDRYLDKRLAQFEEMLSKIVPSESGANTGSV